MASAAPAPAPAPAMLRRSMKDGAVAGTAVGVVVAVLLLIFCLYPVVVHFAKRRRRNGRRLNLDLEAGRPPRPGADAHPGLGFHQRLSSSDSFKRDGHLSRGDLTRGDSGAAGGKETGWSMYNGAGPPGHDGAPGQVRGAPDVAAPAPSIPPGTGGYELQSPLSTYPFYGTEYMPESEVHDDKSGVLKGTSADYYTPSIPSEAFGMVTRPTGAHVDASPAGSRGSSFRYNVRHMFRRKGARDGTADTHMAIGPAGPGHPSSVGGLPGFPEPASSQRLTAAENPTEPAESPSEASPMMATPPAPPSGPADSPTDLTTPQPLESSDSHSPASQLADGSLKHIPSPPSHPAPGTVNPMDIMPASTESEVWHRRAQQLSAPSSHLATGMAAPEQIQSFAHTAPPISPPHLAQRPHGQSTESHAPTELADQAMHGQAQDHGTIPDRSTHDHLSPSTAPGSSRHPSYPSDQSTPFLGPGSTDPSSHNTPSTQIDTPSPESFNSSDFRHSVSPQPVIPVTRAGVFRCDEAGCNQEFDQPHKLKHHQRYHSKDHKCPYPNCGKGFGTKTHLQRHINDRHEKKKKFHCSVPGCDFSRAGGKAFPRKDNWKRHMTKIHNMDHTQLPEPIEVDHEMTS